MNKTDITTTAAIATTDGLIPLDADIICGSGRKIATHPGNKHFRAIVEKHYREYDAATNKAAKVRTTQKVMDDLCRLSPSGSARFL